MDALIQNICDYASPTGQALAVTVGGLVGVFATLAAFYAMIAIANKVADKRKTEESSAAQ